MDIHKSIFGFMDIQNTIYELSIIWLIHIIKSAWLMSIYKYSYGYKLNYG